MGSLTAPRCWSHSLVYILCNVFLLWGKTIVPEQTHTHYCPLAATHLREARNCKGTPLEPQGQSVTTRHTPHRGPIPAPRAQQRPPSRDVQAACTLQRKAGSAWSIQTLCFATSAPLILRLCAQARDGCPGWQPTSWPRISASAVQPGAQPPFQKQLGLLRSWPRPAPPVPHAQEQQPDGPMGRDGGLTQSSCGVCAARPASQGDHSPTDGGDGPGGRGDTLDPTL